MTEIKAPLSQPVSSEPVVSDDNTTPKPEVRKKLMKLEAIRGFAAFYVTCYHTLPK